MTGRPLPHVIAAWPRDARETLNLTLDEYRGARLVDVRGWHPAADGQMTPAASGLTLDVRHLPRLADAIAQALAEARARQWLADGAADGAR